MVTRYRRQSERICKQYSGSLLPLVAAVATIIILLLVIYFVG